MSVVGSATRDARRKTAVVVVLAILALACHPKLPVQTHPPPGQWPHTVEHVIIVTIDGLRADEVGEEFTPNLQRMIDEGAWTLSAQTVYPSLTLPAHCSLLTGLTPDQHHIRWNSYKPEMGDLTADTVFDVARRKGMTTAFVSGKEKLRHIVQPDDVDLCSIEKRSDRAVMDEALSHLYSQRPNLMFVHLPDVDRAGHFAGWKSGRQLQTVEEADRLVGRLLESVENLEMRYSTVVIVTSDHGGQDRHHRNIKDTDVVTIPWIVWGDSIEPRKLAPVSITATANTTLRLLGIDPPRDWIAREVEAAPAGPAAAAP
jgi:predicted AlkP superfamily pyrophosphatase or phosphodiesterase